MEWRDYILVVVFFVLVEIAVFAVIFIPEEVSRAFKSIFTIVKIEQKVRDSQGEHAWQKAVHEAAKNF